MGGTRFQTQAESWLHKAITIPVLAAPATLLSLIGTLDLVDAQGNNLGDISKNLHRVTGVKITGQAGAYLYGKTAALALVPVAATGDLAEPLAGIAMLNAYFCGATAATVAATVVVYFD